jgi:hypothetical protein
MLRFCLFPSSPLFKGESDDLIESFGSVGGGHVPEYSAGACRAELVVVADQPDARAPIAAPGDDMVEREGAGHAGLIDDSPGCPARPHRRAGLGARSRRATW